MSRPKWIVAGCGLICLLGLGWILSRAPRRGLELKLDSSQRTEIIDDSRQRMWLVTLTLTNSSFGPVVFENRAQPLEVRVNGQWHSLTNTWTIYHLGAAHERSSADTELFLLPAAAQGCRLQLRVNFQHEALSFQFFRELGRRGSKPGEPAMNRAIRGQQLVYDHAPRLCDWLGQTNRWPQQYVPSRHWTVLTPAVSLTD